MSIILNERVYQLHLKIRDLKPSTVECFKSFSNLKKYCCRYKTSLFVHYRGIGIKVADISCLLFPCVF